MQRPPSLENRDLLSFTVNQIVQNSVIANEILHAFSKIGLWPSDVTYEIELPSTTFLKLVQSTAVTRSEVPGMQAYLEGLTALHSVAAQAEGSHAADLHVRRELIETVHPVVRVHPVTSWKSVHVNPGVTCRILGVPKLESDTIRNVLFHQVVENVDFQVRFHWDPNSIAFWDDRASPRGEKPKSIEEERQTDKVVEDSRNEILKE
ncbi:TauD-domain-containing protein [Suillus brevipes Sb2]|nr:TauD-domain-containing protein [Suillus brevipes Sb2]